MENTKDIIVRELAERTQKNGDLTKRDIDEVIDKYITIPDEKSRSVLVPLLVRSNEFWR